MNKLIVALAIGTTAATVHADFKVSTGETVRGADIFARIYEVQTQQPYEQWVDDLFRLHGEKAKARFKELFESTDTDCKGSPQLERVDFEQFYALAGITGNLSPMGPIPPVCIFDSTPMLEKIDVKGCSIDLVKRPPGLGDDRLFLKIKTGKITASSLVIVGLYNYSCENGEKGMIATSVNSAERIADLKRFDLTKGTIQTLHLNRVDIVDGHIAADIGVGKLYYKPELF